MIKSTQIIDALGGAYFAGNVYGYTVVVDEDKHTAVFSAYIDKDLVPVRPDFDVSQIERLLPSEDLSSDTIVTTAELEDVIRCHPRIQVKIEEDCLTCDATGEVEWSFRDFTMDHDCPVCDGMGAKKVVDQTRDELNEYIPVKLKNIQFNVSTISKLLAVMKLTDEEFWTIFKDGYHLYFVAESLTILTQRTFSK